MSPNQSLDGPGSVASQSPFRHPKRRLCLHQTLPGSSEGSLLPVHDHTDFPSTSIHHGAQAAVDHQQQDKGRVPNRQSSSDPFPLEENERFFQSPLEFQRVPELQNAFVTSTVATSLSAQHEIPTSELPNHSAVSAGDDFHSTAEDNFYPYRSEDQSGIGREFVCFENPAATATDRNSEVRGIASHYDTTTKSKTIFTKDGATQRNSCTISAAPSHVEEEPAVEHETLDGRASAVIGQTFVACTGWVSQLASGSVWVQYNEGTQLGVNRDQTGLVYVDLDGNTHRYLRSDHVPEAVREKLERLPSVVGCLYSSSSSVSL